MKFSELINAASVVLKFEAKNKKEALQKLANAFHSVCKDVDPKVLCAALTQRETLGSTGLGNGIAIPHAKSEKIARPRGLLAVCRTGVDFHALDGECVYVFFLMVYPPDPVGVHLVALANTAKLLRDEFVVRLIRGAATPGQVIKIIAEHESRTKALAASHA